MYDLGKDNKGNHGLIFHLRENGEIFEQDAAGPVRFKSL